MLSACSDWLDIQPQDTTEDDQLFETGEGFRNALNCVYRQMAGSSMYGKDSRGGLWMRWQSIILHRLELMSIIFLGRSIQVPMLILWFKIFGRQLITVLLIVTISFSGLKKNR